MPFVPPEFHTAPSVSTRSTAAAPVREDDGLLETRVWESGADDFVYPEQAMGVVPRDRALTGVAFSGGGNRAMVAAWGQLRGLVASGLIDKVDYISSVSGGSWAATAFTYYNAGPSNDEEFLGEARSPESLALQTLESLSPYALGVAATESFMSRLIGQALNVATGRITPNEVWLRAVGETFFERYGIYEVNRPTRFSLDDAVVADIVERNPALAGETFHTVHQRTGDAKRPYLIVNSTLMWPPDGADNFVHFEYTPLAVGSKHRLTVYDPPGNDAGRAITVGGGFIEPFAYGATAPGAWPPGECERATGCVRVPPPERPYTLAFASGTSSAAFAATGAGLAGNFQVALVNQYLQQGPPIERYWPVPPLEGGGAPQAETHAFGDGGSLENLGVIPLLLRGVSNIVAYINTERRLDLGYDPSETDTNPPSIHSLDGGISPLFGIAPADRSQPPTPNNQVFRSEDFAGVVRALQRAKSEGVEQVGAAVARTKLEVQDNSWWGLKGGWQAEVCWVYLDRVSEWEAKLQPELARLVAAGRNAGPKDKAPFWGFPNYRTMFQGGKLQMIAMSKAETSLLADLTSWVTTDSSRALLIRRTLGA